MTEPQEVAPETPGLYALTFVDNPTGPRELLVTLPHGGRKKMNASQGDREAEDFPYTEVKLVPSKAVAYAKHVASYGMKLAAIAESALAKPAIVSASNAASAESAAPPPKPKRGGKKSDE